MQQFNLCRPFRRVCRDACLAISVTALIGNPPAWASRSSTSAISAPTTVPGVTAPNTLPGVTTPKTLPGVTAPTTLPGVTVATMAVPGATVATAAAVSPSLTAPASSAAGINGSGQFVTQQGQGLSLPPATATQGSASTFTPGLAPPSLAGAAPPNLTVTATVAGPPNPPSVPGNTTPQGTWTSSKTIDWPAGTTVNDIVATFGFPGAVSAGSVGSPSVLPVDGVVRLAALPTTVDPLAVVARDALDALLARHPGGAPPILVSTDAIESAFKAQLSAAPQETNPDMRYARARAGLALMIAGRMKVSASDLDQVWARTDERRMIAVLAALSQVGTLYQWTGNKPGGFDCSGLTSYAWSVAGVKIPRTSTLQSNAMTPKDVTQLQPGDLLWRPGHVGLYLGAGDAMVDSSQSGKPVKVQSYGSISRFGTFI